MCDVRGDGADPTSALPPATIGNVAVTLAGDTTTSDVQAAPEAKEESPPLPAPAIRPVRPWRAATTA